MGSVECLQKMNSALCSTQGMYKLLVCALERLSLRCKGCSYTYKGAVALPGNLLWVNDI